VRERCRPRFAATAELAGLTVLHNDKDFELIAAITDQPTEQLDLP
jgi:predicted nucleic acid-binding protein